MSGLIVQSADRQQIISQALQRFATGDKLSDIAQDVGVSKSTLYSWMLSDVPAEYRSIQTAAITARLAETYELIETSFDPLELARARELRKASQWDAERRLPHLFGIKQEITTIKSTGADSAQRLERLGNKLTTLLTGKRGDVTDV
jgi:transcriptional regulator with XRE-family HTH domain